MKHLLAFAFTIFYFNSHAIEIDANEIVKKADQKRGLGNISHSFNVSINNLGDAKTEVYKVSFKDMNSSLSEQLEPERARGRKMLMKEYDMWLFTPNIKKPIRISLEQKLTGEVSYGDIAKTNYAEDYSATIIGEEKIKNAECYKIELKAKNKKVTYGRIEYFVSKKDSTPIEATFFALSGKPLKKASFEGFKNIKGIMRSTQMIITDHLMKNKVSTMTFSEHKVESFSDMLFNKDSLEF
jgi:hypothetical protein